MNSIVTIPPRSNKFLVFDVETTGLLPKASRSGGSNPRLDEYPHILQLSFAIFDKDANQIIKQYDSYVRMEDDTVVISELVTGLTGITHTLCQQKGRPIIEVLKEFTKAYMECDCLVAHNMDFDEHMILVELERNRLALCSNAPECFALFSPVYESVNQVERYCTMRKGINLCNILVPMPPRLTDTPTDRAIKPMKKFPKLIELFQTLFPSEPLPLNLHNSMTDVLVCLKCYLKMRHHMEFVQR